MLELGPQGTNFKPLGPPIPLIRTKAIESTNARNTTWLLLGNRQFGKRLSLESGIWMKEGAVIIVSRMCYNPNPARFRAN